MTRRTALFASVTFIALASLAAAQTMPKPAAQESGITAYLQFGGTTNSDGQVYALNPSVGYDFNSHFGMAVGAPVYFVHIGIQHAFPRRGQLCRVEIRQHRRVGI